ncbi:MAG TPA: bacteriocin fulvocin C-related protein [Pyrinomonadaceae bacterium]|nr:bacteriocin fulvocin C-related protein [Pyrinomonadaceae bacterium]
MKITIRLSLLVMAAVGCIVTLVRAQDATSTSTTGARSVERGQLLQNYTKTSAPLPDTENSFLSSWATDKTIQWKVHLAIHLAKRRELNKEQVRIIVDAISLSSLELFAASNDRPTKTAQADDALQALRRRAHAAFSKKQAAELFAHIAGVKTDDDVLKLYYDLSTLSLKERKATFRNASFNIKSDMWRTHLALFLVKRPELDEWQKEIILAAMSLATPEYFEVRADTPAWKTKVRAPLRALEDQILSAFSFKDGAKIFATLGDDADAAILTPTRSGSVWLSGINFRQLSDSGPYKDRTHRFAEQDMIAGGPCECSIDSDWCPITSYCGGASCSPTQSGCGTLWSYPCNGASCR